MSVESTRSRTNGKRGEFVKYLADRVIIERTLSLTHSTTTGPHNLSQENKQISIGRGPGGVCEI